jgi:pantoate--beta-alanine ligase
LIEIVRSTIEWEPSARIDYISITDTETLGKLDKIDERPTLVAVAAHVGKTRLIDNIILNKAPKKDGATSRS